MNSGMYSALSGNLAAMQRLDVISNNLANVNTTGFKRDRLAFDSVLAGNLNPPAVPPGQTADPVLLRERMVTDYTPGSLNQTGNALDIALQGDGFFVVRTPNGIAYTRQGNFRLTQGGELVTSEGYQVLSKAGDRPEEGQPIVLVPDEQGGKPIVDNDGNITMNGEAVAQLAIFDFPKPYALKKVGSALFVPENQQAAPQAPTGDMTVTQGALEQSNVDAISEMVQMVEASRFFETCQRVVRGFDDIAAKATGDLARV